ncbi:putative transcriptional regulator, MerR family [Vibrio nigripulchritudo SOn1]|uniref:Transcriptional regulator, MerR family n=1 Tax=Vibrio nigripulchritudo SOn1 TaxID=1238450 RepID=A0AAV2VHW2_9VIBR|nr:MerR family DNA-binding transcriptional regulator [Vibrio nigripulchritudo]BDU39332.1 MerR family transcriptional regulator [Vibrio nigripulchritudo]BDU45052.1 MerR family transcriptional regulator [Vibrio nigripulchritudo]CCO44258.1 putative transcriptional regulator, MerR family [Vibrio nigripulchritudo SOn1]
MKIGELSKQSGVSIRMLRYYEQQGLLKPKRTPSGYRDFDSGEIRTLERIKLLSAAGMKLTTMLEFLPCLRGDRPVLEPCDELRNLLHEQIRVANEQVAKIAESRKILENFLREIEEN